MFSVKNNAKDIWATILDVRCGVTKHKNYDFCVKVAETYSDKPTLVSTALKPMWDFIYREKE